MRSYTLILASLVLLPRLALAQTPLSLTNVVGTRAAGAAANNPYVGTQLSVKIPGSSEPSDFLLLSAKAFYEVTFRALNQGQTNERPFPLVIPVVANFAPSASLPTDDAVKAEEEKLRELSASTSGVSFGLYPYYLLTNKTDFVLTLHSMVAWRVSSLKAIDGDSTISLQQARLGIGLETQLGVRSDTRKPLTLSAMIVQQKYDSSAYRKVFGTSKSVDNHWEVTAVAPLSAGVALLFEHTFAKADRSRFGLIVAKGL
jgi:hypothetical protein